MRFVFAVVGSLLLLAAIALGMFALLDRPVVIQDKSDPKIEFVDQVQIEDKFCEADQQVNILLNKPQECQSDSDCMITSYGCPFGCQSLVNQKTNQQINEILKQRDCSFDCVYMCIVENEKQAVCEMGICKSVLYGDFEQIMDKLRQDTADVVKEIKKVN